MIENVSITYLNRNSNELKNKNQSITEECEAIRKFKTY